MIGSEICGGGNAHLFIVLPNAIIDGLTKVLGELTEAKLMEMMNRERRKQTIMAVFYIDDVEYSDEAILAFLAKCLYIATATWFLLSLIIAYFVEKELLTQQQRRIAALEEDHDDDEQQPPPPIEPGQEEVEPEDEAEIADEDQSNEEDPSVHKPTRRCHLSENQQIEDFRGAFQQMLMANEWMDRDTREFAIKKAQQMANLIGFSDFLFIDTQLDDYYKKVDRMEFGTSSAVVNAFYSGVKNAVTFPAAILQAPFFGQSFPKAVNYGGIGAVIGHEININGILTQGENIADNGGIKQAYRAYKTYLNKLGREEKRLPGFERYNNEQIFFISFAQTGCGHTKAETLIRQILTDPHSPYRCRVNGVVANQPEFARAFGCAAGA